MKFDLKRPCENCPFRNGPTRIVFACRERAEEIEEMAYRQGFVCHLTADEVEGDEGETHFDFRADGGSQHCAGALLMYLKSGMGGNVPFENLSEDEQARIESRLDWDSPVFESEEEFLEANESGVAV